ncbi:MAG TPA: hypothetical protein VIL24_02900 [Clostridia bacterium]
MKKRLPVLLLALVMALSFCLGVFGCKDKKPKLVVWSMSNEIEDLLKYYTLANPGFEYEFDTRIINNDDGSYETNLDNAFSTKGGPDLFVTDVDYTKKYVESDYTVDLTSFYKTKFGLGKDAGYDEVREQLEVDMYGYTLDIGSKVTADKTELKAVSYQVTPGAMFYRADLFLELVNAGDFIPDEENPGQYLTFDEFKGKAGIKDENAKYNNYTQWTDEDKEALDKYVQKFVSGDRDEGKTENEQFLDAMNKFLDAAERVANSKYNEGKKDVKKIMIINNLEDIKRVFYAQRSAFVEDNKVHIDSNLVYFLDYAKQLYPLTHKGAQWSADWQAGMRAINNPDTSYKTLSFFLPTWGLFYVLNKVDENNEPNKTAGLWRMIEGPQAYYWGGSYLMINKNSKKQDVAFQVLDFLTSLPFMQARSAISGDVMNSKELNNALAGMKLLGNPFLAGQNHFYTFNSLAGQIKASNVTMYDSAVDRVYSDIMRRYADNTIKTKDDAWKEFTDSIKSNLAMEVQIDK